MDASSETGLGARRAGTGQIAITSSGADVATLGPSGIQGNATPASVTATGGTAKTLGNRFLEATRTVQVPSNYASLQAAIDGEAYWVVARGAEIVVNMEAGFQPVDGVSVSNGDYSHYRITSTDPLVTVSASMPTSTVFINGDNAKMPTLDCLITGDAGGGDIRIQDGYRAVNRSTGLILPTRGIHHVRGTGCRSDSASNVCARSTNFTFAAQAGDGSGYVAYGGTLDAQSGDASDSGATGQTGFGYGGQAAHSGVLNFNAGIANRCARYGVRSTDYGVLDFDGGQASDAGLTGIRAFNKGEINARDATANNAGEDGVLASSSSTVNARGLTATGCTQYAVNAAADSRIGCRSGTLGGAVAGVNCSGGSNVDAGSANTTTSPIGFQCDNGSFINTQDATGTTNKLPNVYGPWGAILNTGLPINKAKISQNSNRSTTSATYENVANMRVAVDVGTWLISGFVRLTSAAGTTVDLAINGPTATTINLRSIEHLDGGSPTIKSITAYDSEFGQASGTPTLIQFEGRFIFTAAGNVDLRFRRSAGTGSATFVSASTFEAEREVT